MAEVCLRNLYKRYGKTEILHGINLDIADGEFVVLVGPSGCGKSTTLRMIAGLEEISSGEVEIGGRVVNNVDPKDRNIAMVFQNYAIYPHLTVAKNIAFGLKTSNLSKAEKQTRINEIAQMLGLQDLLERRPSQLSGGQRQRVAMGRAMVRDPAVFLFDEPLSNLDAQLRAQMRLEIKKLHQKIGTTIVFVTHDQIEAMTLADRIVIMREGVIEQIGTPAQVYEQPASSFVGRFIGSPSMNLLEGRVAAGTLSVAGLPDIPVSAGEGLVTLGLRPDDLRVGEGGGLTLSGCVSVLEPLGPQTLVYVQLGEQELIATAQGTSVPNPGETVPLHIAFDRLRIFETATGKAIS